jgi:Ca2+/Na+ antiporter
MKKKKVLSYKSLPTRFPTLTLFVVAFLLFDNQAKTFWWGAFAMLAVLCLVAVIFGIASEENVDIFDENGKIKKDLLP